MAAKKGSSDTQVTRIKADTSSSSKKKTSEAKKVTSKVTKKTSVSEKDAQRSNILIAPFGYFKGAWSELRQVHWPTRKATWGLTLAVLLFSAFFVVVILLLDAAFKYLFELVLA